MERTLLHALGISSALAMCSVFLAPEGLAAPGGGGGGCPKKVCTPPNGVCDVVCGEDYLNCPADCPAPPPPPLIPVCGDGVCEADEGPGKLHKCPKDCSTDCGHCDVDKDGDCEGPECSNGVCAVCDFDLDLACKNLALRECGFSCKSCDTNGDFNCTGTECNGQKCNACDKNPANDGVCRWDLGECYGGVTPPPPPSPPPPPPAGGSPPPPGGACVADPLPDELDVFRINAGGDTSAVPRVTILIDNSASFNGTAEPQNCPWFATTHNGGNPRFKKVQQIQSALIGCNSEYDGILDRWDGRMLFSLQQINGETPEPWRLAEFSTQKADLEPGVMDVTFPNKNPMTGGLMRAGKHFDDYFNDANTSCGQHFIILISDGNTNGSAETYAWAKDASGAVVTLNVPGNGPEFGAKYMQDYDALTKVAGKQTITTFTIGMTDRGAGEQTMLNVATSGGGIYFEASDVQTLVQKFELALNTIATRTAVFGYSAPAIQREGVFFTGDYQYQTSYKPSPSGMFIGNLKKHCIFPERVGNGYRPCTEADAAGKMPWCVCYFKSTDGQNLLTNPEAMDLWTNSQAIATDAGGAGQLMKQRLTSDLTRPRTILTWRAGAAGYVPVTPDNWRAQDAWASTDLLSKLINRIHGYTMEVGDFGNAVAPLDWPLGEAVHADTMLLRYDVDGDDNDDNCDVENECLVLFGANDGQLHVFDAKTGVEKSALIPAEIWAPSSLTNHILKHIDLQPNSESIHRYYLDARIRVFHRDEDVDGLIDESEEAYLIFGLGRGGRAYYKVPINRFNDARGVPNADTPIYPLRATPGNAWSQLRDTWAAPYVGEWSDASNQKTAVAVFPSGHIAEFDKATAIVPWLTPAPVDPELRTTDCGTRWGGLTPNPCVFGDPAGVIPYPDTPDGTSFGPLQIPDALAYRFHFSTFELDPNDALFITDSQGNAATVLTGIGLAGSTDYEGLTGMWTPWIYDRSVRMRLNGNGTPMAGYKGWTIDEVQYMGGDFGIKFAGELTCAGGCRWCDQTTIDGECSPAECTAIGDCSVCDLDNNGACEVSGTNGQECGLGCSWCDVNHDGTCAGDECILFNCEVCDTVVDDGACTTTDGECYSDASGPRTTSANLVEHYPSVFVVDIEKWNGPGTGVAFAKDAGTEGVLMQITRDCAGAKGATGACIDAGTSPDLKNLTCPISAEISAYGVGRIDTLYWGDECGQIWKAWSDSSAEWHAKRIAYLNNLDFSDQTKPQAISKDVRKIFRRIQLVPSTCPGQRVVGLYFGTGNVQRPNAADEIDGAWDAVGSDIIGVVWDDGETNNVSPEELADLTTSVEADAKNIWLSGKKGWYLRLSEDERMLRDPFVVDGVAYYKTHMPPAPGGQVCGPNATGGTDVAYAMDNCSAAPASDRNGDGSLSPEDRVAWTGSQDVGGDIQFYLPPDGPPVVTVGSGLSAEDARLSSVAALRTKRIFLWRYD